MAKEVSTAFRLEPEEAVVMRAEKIGDGAFLGIKTNELILTNRALIYIKKDLLGNTKEVIRYPLEDICMSEGKPQVVLGTGDNVSGSIDVFFQYETAHFKMEWKSDAEEWVASITETVTGEKVPRKNGFEDFDDLLKFADSVTGTASALRKALGIKSTEAVARKCSSCGASLSGIEDEIVICPYCGTHNKMTLS